MANYEMVIGIETHVQLKTKTKLFCGCDNDAREAAPNTKICPVCLGLPGTLPVLNEQAVKLALRAGLALNGQLAEYSKFDRKNYFYPDLPKGYQITQMDQPIIGKGWVEFPVDGEVIKVGITRAHMEEDAGKLMHPDHADYSLVDLNRAGTPLIEIVSEPDMRTPAQAKAYAQEIYNLMRYVDISEANLYYGNMRFDVNISVRIAGSSEFGTRAEIKNLNSFRSVERAAEYEFVRQVKLVEAGDKIVQETRGWNDAKQQTYSQRTKADANDYRYFPEPDLPPLVITKQMRTEADSVMPELPNSIRAKLADVGIAPREIEVLVSNLPLLDRYLRATSTIEAAHAKRIANWLINDVAGEIEKRELEDAKVLPNPEALVELSKLVDAGKISSTGAKAILVEHLIEGTDKSVEAIAAEGGYLQNSDDSEIEKLVDEAIAANPQSVNDYKAGKAQAMGFLVGQIMKASRGQANPQLVNELLRKKIG